jgi:hypothetical protein
MTMLEAGGCGAMSVQNCWTPDFERTSLVNFDSILERINRRKRHHYFMQGTCVAHTAYFSMAALYEVNG